MKIEAEKSYRTVTYAEAKSAHESGQRVEFKQGAHLGWTVVDQLFCSINEAFANDTGIEFRIVEPDPYAELKTAHAAGKVIQALDRGGYWYDLVHIDWCMYQPANLRVKPDPKPELTIEAGKEYRRVNGSANKLRCLCTDAPGQSPYIFINQYGQISRYNSFDVAGLIEWTDTPAPYDNWDKVPAWANWQAMTLDGLWHWHSEKPEISTVGWHALSYSGLIPKNFEPTNYTGEWQNSLQERPIE